MTSNYMNLAAVANKLLMQLDCETAHDIDGQRRVFKFAAQLRELGVLENVNDWREDANSLMEWEGRTLPGWME